MTQKLMILTYVASVPISLLHPTPPPSLPDAVDLATHKSALDAALAGLLQVSSSLVVQEEVEGEDLAHAVDDEMAATERAVSDAVDRIQEMLKRTRETDKGQKLEVNSSILEACTTLMEVSRGTDECHYGVNVSCDYGYLHS